MAQLTQTLADPTRGKPVVEPATPALSPLAGLASLASGGVNAVAENYQRNLMINDRRAVNAVDQGIFDINKDARDQANQMKDVNWSNAADTQLLDRIAGGTGDLDKVRKAVQQGTLPPQALDTKVEALVSSLYQQFPDQKEAITSRLSALGYYHYLFRDQQIAEQQQESDEKQTILMREQYRTAARNAGLAGLPGQTEDQEIDAGRKITAAMYQFKLAQDQVDMAAKKADITQKSYEVNKDVDIAHAKAGADLEINAFRGQFTPLVLNALEQAGNDPEKLAQVEKDHLQIIQTAQQLGLALKNRYMQQPGARPEVGEYYDAQTKAAIDGIEAMFSGPSSQWAQNKRSAENMANVLGMSVDQIMPKWAFFSKVAGSPYVAAQMFPTGIDKALTPETLQAIRQEWTMMDPTQPNTATNRVREIGALIRGEVNVGDIKDLSADHIGSINAALKGTRTPILQGTAGDTEKNMFLHNQESMALMAGNFTPSYHNMTGLNWAAGAIGDKDNVTAMVNLAKDANYSDRAKQTIEATRGAAMNMLLVAPSVPTDKVPGQSVVFDGKQGKYVVKIDPRLVDKSAQVSPDFMSPNDPQMGNIVARSTNQALAANPQLQQQANVMNAALHTLMRTSQFDDSIPKGVTSAQLLDHYVNHTPFPQPESAKAKPDKFSEALTALETQIGKTNEQITKGLPFRNTQSISPNVVMTDVQGMGLSRAAAAGITGRLMHESGLNVNGPAGDDGQAISLAQWHPERQAVAAEHGFDLHTYQGAIGFMKYEFINGDAQAKKAYELLQDPNITPERAAEVFTKYFERPAKDKKTGEYSGMDQTRNYARQFFGEG